MSRPRRFVRWLPGAAACGLVIGAAIVLVPKGVTWLCSDEPADPAYSCESWPPTIAALLILAAIVLGLHLITNAYSRLRSGTSEWGLALLGGIVLFLGGLIIGALWLQRSVA